MQYATEMIATILDGKALAGRVREFCGLCGVWPTTARYQNDDQERSQELHGSLILADEHYPPTSA